MKDLTQGSVTKHLLHMSAFLAASMLVQTLYLLADLYWVGHLGNEAIAAVGVAGNLTMIVLALTQMHGVGTTTLMSQAAGRKGLLARLTHHAFSALHTRLSPRRSWLSL
jgi:MATE family, multidrug efflux pump